MANSRHPSIVFESNNNNDDDNDRAVIVIVKSHSQTMGRPKKITPNIEKAPNSLPGSFDLLPEHGVAWEFFVKKFHNLATTFGYSKVETPLLENAKLFRMWEEAGLSQLLSFQEKDIRIAAKPTNLFGLARSYIENHFYEREKISKWFHYSPVVLVKGSEITQDIQWGLQIFGEITGVSDAQLINLLLNLFNEMGLGAITLEVNNVGCLECLPSYTEVLRDFFKERKVELCENCLEQYEHYPLRILACANLSCTTTSSESPPRLDFLCDSCRKHFISVLEGLDELSVAYNLSPRVIGYPWSRKSLFELRYKTSDAEIILGRGGHADDLIVGMGGPQASVLGFEGLASTLLSAFEAAEVKFGSRQQVDVFLVPLGELAAKKSLKLFMDLWNHNIVASESIGSSSIKMQLKLAESNKVAIALIMGQKEAREGTVILRDVRSGMQELFTVEHIIEEVKKRLVK